MGLRHKRREWMGVVGALGTVVVVAGLIGGFFTPTTTIVLAFAVWVLGAVLVNLLTER